MDKKDSFIIDEMIKLIGPLFKAHPWHGVPIGDLAPREVTAYIELIPSDTIKYELDKNTGYLKVDRPQQFSNICPLIYGLIPQTYCAEEVADLCSKATGKENVVGDKDPLDICIITEKTISYSDILVKAIPIGGFRLIDGSEADDKILSVMKEDAIYGQWKDLSEVPSSLIERIKHYFLTYKDAPQSTKRKCEITHIYGHEEAYQVITRSQKDYLNHYGPLAESLQHCKDVWKKNNEK
ncbi:inorganic pyrophosphatase [PVC group bacterium (ex Bugula neritina AB1)]|nr:inorganic pyrophosphatase [PVC group bacterium (ex Bugula neritina AB1)]